MSEQAIGALVEANEILQEELNRLRNNNRVLRTVIRALRESVTTLREQVAVATQNDDLFKAYCAGDFDASISTVNGGLPEAGEIVEAAV